MSKKELDARRMVTSLRKLPVETQERIGYMIEGARLVVESRGDYGQAEKSPSGGENGAA